MQSLEDRQAFIDLLPTCYSPTLTAVNKITSKLPQMESNGDQWLNEQVFFFFFQKIVAEYVAFTQVDKYIWMTMWSTTGFSLQQQSLINQTSNENYGDHPLEGADLMYQQILRTLMSKEMKDNEGELTVWTLKMMKDTMSLRIYLLLCKAEKLQTISFQILLDLGKF